MEQLKNWDNKTWISSNKYILSFYKFLKTKNKINKKTNILDIGCGSGCISISLALNSNLKMTSLEVSELALIQAKENANKFNTPIHFIHADIFAKDTIFPKSFISKVLLPGFST